MNTLKQRLSKFSLEVKKQAYMFFLVTEINPKKHSILVSLE